MYTFSITLLDLSIPAIPQFPVLLSSCNQGLVSSQACNFHDPHWYFLAIPLDSLQFPLDSMQFPCNSSGFLAISLDSMQFLWIPCSFLAIPLVVEPFRKPGGFKF